MMQIKWRKGKKIDKMESEDDTDKVDKADESGSKRLCRISQIVGGIFRPYASFIKSCVLVVYSIQICSNIEWVTKGPRRQ